MDKKMYVIPFRALKEKKHQFGYEISNSFFEVYQYDEILDADVQIQVEFVKKSTLLELNIIAKGNVKVACDTTNELYFQTIKGDLNLVVKFGETFNDESEDVLILPHEAYEIDIAPFIYEVIVLALPSKKVHPGVLDGTLKSDILDKLKELQPKEIQNNNSIDPRWEKLKGLLTDKKV